LPSGAPGGRLIKSIIIPRAVDLLPPHRLRAVLAEGATDDMAKRGARKSGARKTRSRKGARKGGARKLTGGRKTARKATGRKAGGPKAGGRQTSARKASARKTSARKAAARKSGARRPGVRGSAAPRTAPRAAALGAKPVREEMAAGAGEDMFAGAEERDMGEMPPDDDLDQ
jgi:hypothetical protein